MEGYEWMVEFPALMAIGFAGMLVHFFKQKVKGETIADIASYFSTHFKSTITTIITTAISVAAYYFTLSTETPADIVSVFGFGYMCDSFFNKWDNVKV
jgi:hypothetical protein